MTSIQRKRFIRYANFLNRLPVKHFNLNTICQADKNPIKELLDEENSCGTTACAAGHLPVFNPRVFEFRHDIPGRWGNYIVARKGKKCDDTFDAACEYFGITSDEVSELFEPRRYKRDDWNNPKAVAAKIYKMLDMKIPS